MGSTTSQVSDGEIFDAARRAYPAQRVAIEDFRVAGSPPETEVRLLVCRVDRWKRELTAGSRGDLLMILRSKILAQTSTL